ncbi:MAG: phage holin family protein [Nitriliruptorales bacterium]|nr:phage holin family protein [Nitriliruptorales bacterium]
MATERDVVDHAHPPAASPQAGDPRSTGQVVNDILTEIQTIVKKEIELAKHEMAEAAAVRAQAAAAAVVGGLMALFALGFGGATAAKALEIWLQPWAAWLIVFGAFLLIALVAFLIAKSRANAVPMQPEKTKRSIEENVRWARTQLKR